MRRLSIYHIETLLWIARLGTFAAAAERLNTTQPAISARVRELEQQLGYTLFQKVGRRMALTARGRLLVSECEELWVSLERTLQGTTASEAKGLIRIGAGEIAAATCIPRFLVELTQSLEQVQVELEIDLSHGLLQKLLNAQCDLILLVGPAASPAIETVTVGDIDLVWAAHPTLLDDLAGLHGSTPLWLLHRHSPIRQIALASRKAAGLGHLPVHTSNNVRALIDIAVAGGGVTFIPRNMIADHLENGDLALLADVPAQSISFFAAIRTLEMDPLVREVFRRARDLDIGRYLASAVSKTKPTRARVRAAE